MKQTHEIELPWPDSALSPNARGHWRKRHSARKLARVQAVLSAKMAGLAAPEPGANGRIRFEIDLYPPDRRARDDDNLIAALKPSRDGIAQALGIDDRLFTTQCTLHHTKPVNGGLVKIRLSPH